METRPRRGGFRAKLAVYDPNSESARETRAAVEAAEAEEARLKQEQAARDAAHDAALSARWAERRAKIDAGYKAALPTSLPNVTLCGHTNGGLAPGLWYKANQHGGLGEELRYHLRPVTSFRLDVLRAYATGAVHRQHKGHQEIAKAELGRRGECYFGSLGCKGLLKSRPRDWLCEGCRDVREREASAAAAASGAASALQP